MGIPEGGTTSRGRASREAILDAAVAEFTFSGYRKSSLSAIASRAAISKSGLIHHFQDKPALLAAVFDERTAMQRHPERESPTHGFLEWYTKTAQINDSDIDWVRFFSIMVGESLTESHPAYSVVKARYENALSSGKRDINVDLSGLDDDVAASIASLGLAVLDGLQIQKVLDPTVDMGARYEMFVRLVKAYFSGDVARS